MGALNETVNTNFLAALFDQKDMGFEQRFRKALISRW